jgi:hypothetical protein
MKSKSKQVDPEQSKRFIDMARELGPDETGEKFKRALGKIAKVKPATKSEPKDGR